MKRKFLYKLRFGRENKNNDGINVHNQSNQNQMNKERDWQNRTISDQQGTHYC